MASARTCTLQFLVCFQDYQRMLDLIRDIILATDLAHHLRIFKDLQKMADGISAFGTRLMFRLLV